MRDGHIASERGGADMGEDLLGPVVSVDENPVNTTRHEKLEPILEQRLTGNGYETLGNRV